MSIYFISWKELFLHRVFRFFLTLRDERCMISHSPPAPPAPPPRPPACRVERERASQRGVLHGAEKHYAPARADRRSHCALEPLWYKTYYARRAAAHTQRKSVGDP